MAPITPIQTIKKDKPSNISSQATLGPTRINKNKKPSTTPTPDVDISSDILASTLAPLAALPARKNKRHTRDSDTEEQPAAKHTVPMEIMPSSPPPTIQPTSTGYWNGEAEENQTEEEVIEIEDTEMEEKEYSDMGKLVANLLQTEMTKLNQKLNERNLRLWKKLNQFEEREKVMIATLKSMEEKLDQVYKQQVATPDTTTTNNKESPATTYASVAASTETSNTNSNKKSSNKESTSKATPKPPTKAERTLILPRSSNEKTTINLPQLRENLNNTLKEIKAPSNAIIISITQNLRGNFVILTRDDCKAETLLPYKETLEKKIKEADPTVEGLRQQETWAKVMVHGISLLDFKDTQEGMQTLKEEIEQCNSNITLMNLPRYMSKPEARVGKLATSAVVAVRTEAEANKMLLGGLMIGGKRCKTEKYFASRPTDQCSTCQGFGHHWQKCRKEARCRICSEQHKTTEHECKQCPQLKGKHCSHTTLKCINCQGNHRASDPVCPDIQLIRAKFNLPFNYPTPNAPAAPETTCDNNNIATSVNV